MAAWGEKMPQRSVWLKLALVAVLGALTGWWVWQTPQNPIQQGSPAPVLLPLVRNAAASLPNVGISSDEQNNIEVYKAVSPAVVNITSTTIQYDFFFNVFPTQGSGSGFLIDDQGDMVTNYHVISGARSVEVTLWDQSRHPAKLVGRDPVTDLAVIKIDAQRSLPYVELGDSDQLQVGQKVLAIGNPFGFEGTLTTGIISSLQRNIRDEQGRVLENLIQTDAAINPGNSGGPLLNARGEVIGINTAIFGRTNLGIGFAIPVNLAKAIVADLLREGRVRRAYLGAIGQDIAPPIAELLQLPASEGILIARLTRGGPAEQAGLQAGRRLAIIGNQQIVIGGDFIVELDGNPIPTSAEMGRYILSKRPGETVRVTLYRGNRRMTLDVELGERPDLD